MWRKLAISFSFFIAITFLAGCGGELGPGNFLGIPAFILDPI
jgi:hypothetical protein